MITKTIQNCVFISSFLFVHAALSALPPLNDAERESLASDIVVGYVVSIKKKEVAVAYGTKSFYTVQMIVSEIEKGQNVRGGRTLTVNYWKSSFNSGYCGDSGQINSMKHYEMVKAYLQFDPSTNRFNLLHPNGFELIPDYGL